MVAKTAVDLFFHDEVQYFSDPAQQEGKEGKADETGNVGEKDLLGSFRSVGEIRGSRR